MKKTPRKSSSSPASAPKRKPRRTSILAGDASTLKEVLGEISAADRFAFDTEFVMEDRYEAEVCLIQVATESMVAIIDPLAGLDDSGFWELVADENIEKVVHSGAEDLALCFQHIGKVPRNVFDLQIAAGLAGPDYPLSLMKLVRATCGVRLHKSQTLTDWRRRPLTDAQLQYARDDVAYLLSARRTIGRKLERKERMDWAREEFARFERPETYHRPETEQATRLKGAGSLDGTGLAIARELLKVREDFGRQFNRPPRVILKDHLIVEIARHRWTTPAQIRGLRSLQLSNAGINRLAQAVKRGVDAPPVDRPESRAPEMDTAEEAALISLATAVVRDYCQRNDIAYQLAATKLSIRLLTHTHTRKADDNGSPLLNGWRGKTVGNLLTALFSGKVHVGVRRRGRSVRMMVE
ncbi:MAG: ribonuclease D [bacterium]|nr:ribonuclease D [bacterium]